MSKSKLHLLRELPDAKKKKFLNSLSESEARALLSDYDMMLRPEQMIPEEMLSGKYRNWLIISGRGWGKNFSASKTLYKLIKDYGYKEVIYVGRTKEDIRDIIVDGPSGLRANCPPDMKFTYEGHRSRIIIDDVVVKLRSGETPDSLRGPNTDLVIMDELAAYQYPDDTFDQAQMGLRLNSSKGFPPICIITTTPRPIDLIIKLTKDEENTYVTRGKTYDNPDLSKSYLDYLKSRYENTTLGRQELYGEVLDRIVGALWNRELFLYSDEEKEYKRVVIAVDPAVTSGDDSDLTGIVVVGETDDYRFEVLEDASARYTPGEWAKKVVELYDKYDADRVIAEVNNGGDLVERNIRVESRNISYRQVRATKGKYTRAEPIAALYEKGLVLHKKMMAELEDEMVTYVPGVTKKSPDRMDALVWALTYLTSGDRIIAPDGMVEATDTVDII